MRKTVVSIFFLTSAILPAGLAGTRPLPRGFVYLRDVAPDIVQEMRYFGSHNFLGRPVDGYRANECILTRRAANALARVQARLRKVEWSLKVYDCYRPQRGVADFVKWAKRPDDTATKAEFYPTLNKKNLFKRHYIAKRSGHSRGSTVDLTIIAWPPAKQAVWSPDNQQACHLPKSQRFGDNSLDFGTGYDCFHTLSHTANPAITGDARHHRTLLVNEMKKAGFKNYRREWWHFSLRREPYKRTYFNFPVTSAR
jgi:D-alanyl-D-alanine dipeptidase